MIVVLLFSLAASKQIVYPKITIYNETIKNSFFNQTINTELDLTYTQYPGVYHMVLNEQNNNVSQSVDKFQEIEIREKRKSGCVSEQPSLDVFQRFRYTLETQDGIYYTDLVSLSNTVYLVRSDYLLFQIQITGESLQLLPVSRNFSYLIEKGNIYSNPQMVVDKDHEKIYIITEEGGVSFSLLRTLEDEQFTFNSEDFRKRSIFYNVYFNQFHSLVFVALGPNGCDIYDLNEGKANYVRTVTGDDLGIQNMNIVFLSMDAKNSMLYLLDSESGLYFFDFEDAYNIRKNDFFIEIAKGQSFDHFGSTFFIIAKMASQDYAVEVFVNFDDQSYFFNRVYYDDVTIYDIAVFNHFAVLIGFDAHKVVYHSLYHGFLNKSKEANIFFQELQMHKIKPHKGDSKEQYLLGLGRSELKIFSISNNLPQVICRGFEQFDKKFNLLMYSTNCKKKQLKSDTSPFSTCLISHQFQYIATDVMQTNKLQFIQEIDNTVIKYKYEFLIGLLVMVLLLLALMGYACSKFWKHTLNYLSQKIKKKQQIAFEGFNAEEGQTASVEISQLGLSE